MFRIGSALIYIFSGGEQLGRLESIDDYEERGGDRSKPMPSSFFLIDMDQKLIR